MSVSDLKCYLKQRGEAPLVDIANYFKTEPDAVLGMLEHWQRKGRVAARISAPQCSGCNSCGNTAQELYRWVG
jgi:hypothetical protein